MQTRTRSIPVVAMTAYWAADVHERADRAGMTSILMKPCQPDHLIAELHRVLRSTQLPRVPRATRCRRCPTSASRRSSLIPRRREPGSRRLGRRLTWPWLLAALGLVAVAGVVLLAMGQVPICKCGYVKLWHGVVFSSENSQHISDWYTFSHIIHGFAFYGLLWLVGRRWPIGVRLVLAVLLESGWEIFENTDMVINRYREVTISLDYYGDSVINSVCDILAMVWASWPRRGFPSGRSCS